MHSHDSPQHKGSKPSTGSLLGEALKILTRLSSRNPRMTLCFVLLVSCVAVGYTASCLQFHTERSDLIDPEADFHKRWIEYTESFGDSSDIVVLVEGEQPGPVQAALEDLGGRLSREPELFSNILYKADTSALRRKGLQYFEADQLAKGLNRLTDYQPLAQGRWEAARLDYAIRTTDYRLRTALNASDPHLGNFALDRADRMAKSLSGALDQPGKFASPWPEIIPGSLSLPAFSQNSNYLLNNEGTMGFLKVVPAANLKDNFNGDSKAVDRIRELIGQMTETHPHVKIGVTGIPVLENDEMRRSQSDMMLASVISFVAVGLLLFIGFRGIRHPMLGMVMLLVGMSWTFGYTTLVVGHLNILSVSFAVILIGLGIDFAIHYLARYLELRHQGEQLRPALRETSSTVGTGIVTAALTTALAFFCATFTQFLGVAELGIIAGGGILLCCAATFLVLPALISLSDQNVEPKKLPTPFDGDRLRTLTTRFPRLVMILSLVVIVGLGSQIMDWTADGGPQSRVQYDYNLLNLQADGLESVEVQKRAFGQANDSLLFAVSIADTPADARRLKQQFEALPSVQRVEELASRLPAHSPEATAPYARSYRARLAGLTAPTPDPVALNPASVGRAFEELLSSLRRVNTPAALETAQIIDRFLDRFETMSLKSQTEFLSTFQARSTMALWRQLQALGGAADSTPITPADLPPALVNRFVNEKGQWLVQVYPKEQIWDVEPLTRFVQDVRTVDPNVTGTPLQNFEASRQIRDSYQTASLYALGVICLVLLVDFLGREHKFLVLGPPLAVVVFAFMMLQTRRVEVSPLLLIGSYLLMATAIAAILDINNLRDAMLAMIPPVAGGLMMFGILGLCGLDLNPANLIVLPLILGIGVDDGVHVVHDFRQQTGRYRISSSTMNAIVLTSLTSMIGFGSMMVAAHRGLSSVGLVLVIGVGSCLFVSLVTLPAILTFVANRSAPDTADSSSGPERNAGGQDSRDSASRSQQHQQYKRRAA
jgi:hopanoid biosynthesis associated RND transporter like protein HpnN